MINLDKPVHCPSGGFLTYTASFVGTKPQTRKVYTHEYLADEIIEKWNRLGMGDWEYKKVSFEKVPVPNLNGVRYVNDIQDA